MEFTNLPAARDFHRLIYLVLSSIFRSCSIDSDRMKSVKHTIIGPSVRAIICYFTKRIFKEVCSGKNQSRKIFKGCLASLGYKGKIRSHYNIKCSLLSTKYNNIFNLIVAFVPDWKKVTTRGSENDSLLLVASGRVRFLQRQSLSKSCLHATNLSVCSGIILKNNNFSGINVVYLKL